MDKLQELYAKRKVFEDYGAPIPAELAEEIASEEKEMLLHWCYWAIEYLPRESPIELPGRYTVLAEYNGKELMGIGIANNMVAIDNSDFYLDATKYFKKDEETQNSEGTEIDNDQDNDADRIRSRSIPFIVRFENGRVVFCGNAQKTFIESLKYMGLDKVSQYKGELFKGYQLVDKREYKTSDGQPRQKLIDGWWIYTNMPNGRKKRCILGVAKMLGIKVTIEDMVVTPSLPKLDEGQQLDTVKPKGKNARFSLNGSEPMAKNRSVLESVRRFISQFPDATFEDIAEMFPKHLQGSYGVVRTIDDITVRSTKNKSEGDRWFLDPSEILTAADGKRFAVSTEWGHQFPQFQKHLADAFGWLLEEV